MVLHILVNYSYSSNRFEIFLNKYSCSLKCIEKNLVNCTYFGSCPRCEISQHHFKRCRLLHPMSKNSWWFSAISGITFNTWLYTLVNHCATKVIQPQCETPITLFRFIGVFYETGNILQNIPHIQTASPIEHWYESE
jgi:hypothetical protein